MSDALRIPTPTNEDRLDHGRAVWREGRPLGPLHARISVDYGGGVIARTHVKSVPDWAGVVAWRWGWEAA